MGGLIFSVKYLVRRGLEPYFHFPEPEPCLEPVGPDRVKSPEQIFLRDRRFWGTFQSGTRRSRHKSRRPWENDWSCITKSIATSPRLASERPSTSSITSRPRNKLSFDTAALRAAYSGLAAQRHDRAAQLFQPPRE
jgi:hypothetical protein